MKIVALDLASVTGVAVGSPGSAPATFTRNLGQADHVRFANALRMVDQLLREHRPSLVAIEAPIGGVRTSHTLVGIWACCVGACEARGVRVQTHDIGAIRRHFLGQHITSASVQFKHLPQAKRKAAARKEIKGAVIARCRSLGWSVADDNCADAAALFDFACSKESHAHAVMTAGGLFT